MKKLILVLVSMVPAMGWGALQTPASFHNPLLERPMDVSNFSETTTLEWGCPVADRIAAGSKAEAIQKVRAECEAEAHKAAASKPEVLDVIQTKVVWPDVSVLELSDGYHLSGTFFLETTVVQRMSAEVR